MMKRSAGILPFKVVDNKLFVYLEHPGGPYWKCINKWSICKGEYNKEKAIDAAIREFEEETSFKIDKNKLFFIGSKKQSNNKLITIFGTNIDLDPSKMKSNTFKIEYPANSGIFKEFPEMDEAKWFNIEDALSVIFDGQKSILIKLNQMFIDNLL